MQKLKGLAPEKYLSESLSPDLILAPMRMQDVEQVLEIEHRSFSLPWSRTQFQDEILRNPLSHPVVLKRRNAGVIGYCVCWIVAGELHINNIAVCPEERRRGYGEILMRWSLDFGRTEGCRSATLEVRISNEHAIRLYDKLGFQQLGIAPGYYEDTGEDAFILAKKLKAG